MPDLDTVISIVLPIITILGTIVSIVFTIKTTLIRRSIEKEIKTEKMRVATPSKQEE